MSRLTLEDNPTRNMRLEAPRYPVVRQVLTGALSIPYDGATIYELNPNGADRTVQLPTPSVKGGKILYIKNIGSANVLNVVDHLGAAVTSIASNGMSTFISGTTSWSLLTSSPLYVPDGTEALPGLAFSADTNNGLYRIGADDWGLVAGGKRLIRLTGTGDIATSVVAFDGTKAATSTTSASATFAGGVGIAGALYVGGVPTFQAITALFSNSTSFCPQVTVWNTTNDANGGYFIVQSSRAASGAGAASQVGDTLGTFLWKGVDSAGTAARNACHLTAIVAATTATTVTANFTFNVAAGVGLTVVGSDAQVQINQTTPSTSTSTGALRVFGGVGVAGALFVGGLVNISTSGTSGAGAISALRTQTAPNASDTSDGAVRFTYNLSAVSATNQLVSRVATYLGQNNLTGGGVLSILRILNANSSLLASTTTTDLAHIYISGSGAGTVTTGYGIYIDVLPGTTKYGIRDVNAASIWRHDGTTASVSTGTGALVVSGGVGIAGALYTGAKIVTTASGTSSVLGQQITVTQTSPNAGDTGDSAASYVYELSASSATTQLISRVFQYTAKNTLTGGGAITHLRNLTIAVHTAASTTTTNYSAIYVENGTTSGTVTTGYGLNIQGLQGTTQYGIFDNVVASIWKHNGTAASSSATTGALQVAGGFGLGGSAFFDGGLKIFSSTVMPAGGTAGAGLKFSTTANFGVFFGSGAPTLSAAKGSLYLRSDGSGTTDRAYINTDGGTTWTALTTVA